MSENTQEEKVIQILKDRGIIESEHDFNAYILVVGEDEDCYEVVIDGTLEIKKNKQKPVCRKCGRSQDKVKLKTQLDEKNTYLCVDCMLSELTFFSF